MARRQPVPRHRCPSRARSRSRSLAVPSAVRRLSATNLLHRGDDPWVCTAPADVAAHRFANVVVGRPPRFVEDRDGRHDLTRRAVAALEAVVRDERLLHRMQPLPRREAFDRRYAVSLLHDGECHARELTPSVDVNRARAALPVIAPLLRAGETGVLAERVEQRDARLEVECEIPAVDVERYALSVWRGARSVGSRALGVGFYRTQRQREGGSERRRNEIAPRPAATLLIVLVRPFDKW